MNTFEAILTPPLPGHPKFQQSNAFTTSTSGGNPATIVFLDKMLPDEVLFKINANFNQPIVVYISRPKSDTQPKSGCAVFGLRWFGPRNEMRICGHGTLTAAHAVFRLLDTKVTTLEFETLSGTLTAHRVDDKISMELPAGATVPTSAEEEAAVKRIFTRALGKPEVNIRYVGYGGPGFENYLFVELDKSEKLGELRPNVEHFAELAPRTQILVVASASQQEGIAYETRMFAPTIGVGEDHVCGSAHCLNAPYWAAKAQDEGYTEGRPQHAKAVSIRGGDVWASYFAATGRVQVRGNVKLVAEGMLDLTDIIV
ncbi:hypothetical protein DFH06DRAFT_1020646 [Mycena polygramma]|nr:hypothetical protein DFH06DRAFT_1020646 [Mycena polygramma]